MATITDTWRETRAARAARPVRPAVLPALVKLAAKRLPNLRRVRTCLLQVAGFGFIDYAVWGWHHLVGYAAVGLSLLVLEALSGDRR